MIKKIIPGSKVLAMQDALDDTVRNLSLLTLNISSGYLDLDILTGGFKGGEFIVLASRAAVGKSALAMNIALNVAKNKKVDNPIRGKAVGVLSLEMKSAVWLQRVLACESGVDFSNISAQNLTQNDMGRIRNASEKLNHTELFIDDSSQFGIGDSSHLGVDGLIERIREMKEVHGVDLLIIDYLQLIHGREQQKHFSRDQEVYREQEIAEISRTLKALANELDIAIILLAQLNRFLGTSMTPNISHLHESEAVGKDADVILILDDLKNFNEEERTQGPSTFMELIVAKSRNNKTGKLSLKFTPKSLRFTKGGHDEFRKTDCPQ